MRKFDIGVGIGYIGSAKELKPIFTSMVKAFEKGNTKLHPYRYNQQKRLQGTARSPFSSAFFTENETYGIIVNYHTNAFCATASHNATLLALSEMEVSKFSHIR